MKQYSIEEDHRKIKELIKVWEIELDFISSELHEIKQFELRDRIDALSQEMMSINI